MENHTKAGEQSFGFFCSANAKCIAHERVCSRRTSFVFDKLVELWIVCLGGGAVTRHYQQRGHYLDVTGSIQRAFAGVTGALIAALCNLPKLAGYR